MCNTIASVNDCPGRGCSGKTRYYHGFLGYEAYVCDECGEHWGCENEEEFQRHLKEHERGVRNGSKPLKDDEVCNRMACQAPLDRDYVRIWNNPTYCPGYRNYCIACARQIIEFNQTLPEDQRLRFQPMLSKEKA